MSQQDSFNPYRAPDSASQITPLPPPDETLWRDGDDLLCLRDTPFPAHCVKCGVALRNDELNKRSFYWHPPGWYALILVSIVIYAMAALVARKRSSHVLGLCAAHRRRRDRFILLTAGAFVAGPLLGFAVGDEAGLWLGLGLFLVMLVVGLLGARILVPRRMDERYARYKGVGPAFLARLPALPAALRR